MTVAQHKMLPGGQLTCKHDEVLLGADKGDSVLGVVCMCMSEISRAITIERMNVANAP